MRIYVQLSSCNYSAIIWLRKINDEIILVLKFYELVGVGVIGPSEPVNTTFIFDVLSDH